MMVMTRKTRRPLSKPVDQNFAAISIQGTSSNNALEDGVDEGSAFKHVSPNGTAEGEVRGTGTSNPLDARYVKNLEDLQHEQMDNDLADSGDEMAHGALSQPTGVAKGFDAYYDGFTRRENQLRQQA
ncbi:hypothetical protein ACE6H2_016248 [Prunus campanulata]